MHVSPKPTSILFTGTYLICSVGTQPAQMACDYEQGDPFHSDLIPRAHTGKCVSYNTRHLKSEERILKNEGEWTEVEIRMRKNIPDSGGSVKSYFPLRRNMLNIHQKEPVKVTKRMETYKLKSPPPPPPHQKKEKEKKSLGPIPAFLSCI